MVRLLLIRHGESRHNVFMQAQASAAASAEDFVEAMRGENSQDDGDVALTVLGAAQARRLAEVWGPLLQEKAVNGQLHIFVSPMRRALDTADPLMRSLHAACGQMAVVNPAIMEFGGLTAPSDMAVYAKADKLRRKGDKHGMISLLTKTRWRACGFTGTGLLQAYPWARLPADFPAESPWYAKGFEGPKKAAQRIEGLTNDILMYPKIYAEGDLVVHVGHSGTIGDVMHRLLLGRARPHGNSEAARSEPLLDGVHNSSVTSLLLPGDDFPFAPDVRGSGQLLTFNVLLEFANNTTHLGEERLRQWAADNDMMSSKL